MLNKETLKHGGKVTCHHSYGMEWWWLLRASSLSLIFPENFLFLKWSWWGWSWCVFSFHPSIHNTQGAGGVCASGRDFKWSECHGVVFCAFQ